MAHHKEMFLACAHGDTEKIKELVKEHGVGILDIQEPSKGASPLHFAVVAGEAEVVKLLLKLGANINAQSESGDTALHVAIMKDKDKLAKLLIAKKIDTTIKNKAGKSALQLLKSKAKKAEKKKKEEGGEGGEGGDAKDADAKPEGGEKKEEGDGKEEEEEEDGGDSFADLAAVAAHSSAGHKAGRRRGDDTESPTGSRTATPAPGAAAAAAGATGTPTPSVSLFPVNTEADQPPSSIKRLRELLAPKVRGFPPPTPLRESTAPQIMLTMHLPDDSLKRAMVPEDYTGQELLQLFAERSNLKENDLFELVVRDASSKRILMYVDADRTVKEHNIPKTELSAPPTALLDLRAKYYKIPAGKVDPAVMDLLFNQARRDIVSGAVAVSETTAVQLAALVFQALYGTWDRKRFGNAVIETDSVRQFLPPKYAERYDSKYWTRRLYAAHKRVPPMSKYDAQMAYLELAGARAPTFGATFFECRNDVGERIQVAVAQDGVLIKLSELQQWEFYSYYRKRPGSFAGEVRNWRRDDNNILLDVFKDEEVKTLKYMCAAGRNAAEELIELISGYYLLIVFGDSLPTRPICLLEDFICPREALPMRTVCRQPAERTQDVPFQTRLDCLRETYYTTSANAHTPLIMSVFAPMDEAQDSNSNLTKLTANGDWSAEQLTTLTNAFKTAVTTECPADLLFINELDFSHSTAGSDGAKVSSLERLLSQVGDKFRIVTINLEDCHLNTEDNWKSLYAGLLACYPLENLNVSHNIINRNAALEILRAQTREKHNVLTFDMSFCDIDTDAVVQIGKRIYVNFATYVIVNLANNKIDDFGLKEGIIVNMNANTTIRSLDISNNPFTIKGVREQLLPWIEGKRFVGTLKLQHMGLTGKDIDPIVGRINNSTLAEIDLTGNHVGRGLEHLFEAFARNTSLTAINVSDTELEKHGVEALCASLGTNRHLKTLNVSNNGLSKDQACHIIGALAGNRTLLSLDLSGNGLKHDVADAVADVLKNNVTLQELNLARNKLGPESGAPLGQALTRNKCSFSKLDISGNKIGAGIREIGAGLESNTRLKTLIAQDNALTNDQLGDLLNGMKTNTGLELVDVRNNTIHYTPEEWTALFAPMPIGAAVML